MANPIAVPGSNVPSGAAVSPGGAQGVAGVTGTPAWSTNTAGFTIPNVGSTVSVTVADASWIVAGEMVYVDQAGGGVGLPGVLQVQSKSGNTLTLLNPSPAPAIPSASNTQPGLLNQLSGNSTDFVGGDNACHSIAASITATSGFISKTSAYTLQAADSGKYVICSGGNWTLTLPAPVVGLNYRLRNDTGITGPLPSTFTLQPLSGTIDGQASIPLLAQQECTIITDGTNWRTHGLKREVILGTQDITSAQASASIFLPVGYRLFELEFTALAGSANNTYICARLSQDGGNTFATTGYWSMQIYNNSATAVAASSTLNGALWYFGIFGSAGAGNDAQMTVKLFPGNASRPASYLSQATGYWDAVGCMAESIISGMFGPLNPINALQYLFNTGNIVSSYLTVKGVV
jgi:hypothetical protein